MSSESATSPSTDAPRVHALNKVRTTVRAGLNAAAGRRRRVRRRSRSRRYESNDSDAASQSSPPAAPGVSNSVVGPEHDAAARKRNVANVLLAFPEHDASTVAALLNHYKDKTEPVFERLKQARDSANALRHRRSHPPAIAEQRAPTLQHAPSFPLTNRSSLSPNQPSTTPFQQLTSPNASQDGILSPQRTTSRQQTAPRDRASASLFPNSPLRTFPATLASPTTPMPSSSVTPLQLSRPQHRRSHSRPYTDSGSWNAPRRPHSDSASANSAPFITAPRITGAKRGRASQHPSEQTPEATVSRDVSEAQPQYTFGSAASPSAAMSAMSGSTGPFGIGGLGGLDSRYRVSMRFGDLPPDASEQQVVNRLVRRLTQLEDEYGRFEKESLDVRAGLQREIERARMKVNGVENMHETLTNELEENQKRVYKIEQYLDIMRRDVVLAISRSENTFVVIARTGMNNLLYYVLAYLVPVFAFIIRMVRDLLIWMRKKSKGNEDDVE